MFWKIELKELKGLKMFAKISEKFKTKGFWAGLLTGLGSLIAGSLTVPEFIISLINMISG